MSKILGIDLGTTNSAMAITEGGEPKILENAEGARTTPSVVAYSKNDERLTGLLAKRQAVTNPENTLYGVKRLIGHKFEDEAVEKDKKNAPFTIEKADDGVGVKLKMSEKWYRPEEISAMVLQKMKQDAESKTGETIEKAVITVPAYFDDSQRQATKDAGTIAGFDVERIINEPTAAALAYGFDKKKDGKIAVYDFGGGTFDISVLEVGDDVIEVKSTDGNSHMGGEDIDREIMDWIVAEFKKDQGMDISTDVLARQRLKEAAEKAKHELSTTQESEINIPFITSDESGPKHLVMKLTRAQLDELARSYIEKSIEITKRAVDASPFEMSEIDDVILVGGQTRMPAVIDAVQKCFGKEPNRSINPDEVVAMGAAVQAGILQGDVKDILLLDVIPLSLGIETLGGVSTKLIENNTTLPASQSQTFSTAADNQTSVEVHVVQGERPMAADNKSLGRFILDGIPPAPRGVPQIEVSFDVDQNGILNVKARDNNSGKEQSIRIEASSGLSEDDIEQMKKEAEEHAEEDKKKQELVEAKNNAETLTHTAEKSLSEAGDKVSQELKDSVEEKVKAVREVKDGEDLEAIKKASDELSTEMQKIGEAMAGAQSDGSAAAEGTEASGEEKVHEGEETDGESEKSENDQEENNSGDEKSDQDTEEKKS